METQVLQKSETKPRLRRTKVGVVVSNKMQKSAVVLVERRVRHPIFQKYYQRSKKYLVHDEGNACNIGDKVMIVEIRPLSKKKRWKVNKIIEKVKV